MKKFKEGDKVNHLTNGNYMMIVTFVYSGDYEGRCICRWLNEKGKPQSEEFNDFELEPYE